MAGGSKKPKCKHSRTYETSSEVSAAAARAQAFRQRGLVVWARCPECHKFYIKVDTKRGDEGEGKHNG